MDREGSIELDKMTPKVVCSILPCIHMRLEGKKSSKSSTTSIDGYGNLGKILVKLANMHICGHI